VRGAADAHTRVPDKLQRVSVAAQSRDPEAVPFPAAWAPALQRTAEGALRCVRGTSPSSSCIATHIIRAASHSRGMNCPSFAVVATLASAEGAGKAGCRLAPAVRCARNALEADAQRHTGEAKHPAFPAQWFYGLCRDLPGERCTIAPVALRMADAKGPVGPQTSPQDLAHRLRTPGRHDFAVREPYRSCARGLRSRLPALRNPSRRCGPRPPPPGPRS